MSSVRFPPMYSFIVLLSLGAIAVGCGGGGGGAGGGAGIGTATIVAASRCIVDASSTVSTNIVSSDGDSSSSVVSVTDIDSLKVTVTEVILQQCAGDDHDEDADDMAVVEVEDFAFSPTSVTIEQGGTVRWVWREDALHTVTSGSAGDLDAGFVFDASADTIGQWVEVTFDNVGTFPYFSNIGTDIAQGMVGLVDVVPDDDGVPPLFGIHHFGADNGAKVTVFEGAFDLELVNLTTMDELLFSVDLPAGRYCKIRLRIENPRLVLAADPGTVLTNIRLTANGHLFIGTKFTIVGGAERIMIVDFGCVHLIDAGSSGQYVLTPQLRADVFVTGAQVSVEGELVSVDCEAGVLILRTDFGNEFEVLLDGDTVFQDELGNPIACSDLGAGQRVEVEGFLTMGGMIEADEVEVESEED